MNQTLNGKDADHIQYILWCLTNTTDPMAEIQREMKKYDMYALWQRFIRTHVIDWDAPLPVTDSADDKVLA